MSIVLKYEKKSDDIKDPKYIHSNDSGMDIFSPELIVLKSQERKTINTGIKFNIITPLHFNDFGLNLELQIRPKSGMSKDGIEVSLGTIDNGYSGWVHATLTNFTNHNIIIEKGQKIAQIVMMPVITNIELIQGKVEENTSRGTGGLGSTGKF